METTDDSVLYEDSFQSMKVAELRAQLKARNLPTTGLRLELISRLQEAVATSKDSVDEEDDDDDEEDDAEGDLSSEMPSSKISLFADSHITEELQDDEIFNDPDSPAKEKQDSYSNIIITTPHLDTKLSSNEVKLIKTPLKPLKRTTTSVPSNGTAPGEKKVCLSRITSVLSDVVAKETEKKSSHLPVTVDSDDSSDKKSVSTKTLTPQEKLALRAKRFNLTSTDTTKLKVIGKTTSSPATKSNIVPISFESAPDMDKLKKRAERFGVVSTVLKKIEETDKVKQRLKRFSSSGAVSSPKDDDDADAKRKLRMQRFGVV